MKVHLIGVCGTAMASLAILLKQRGAEVIGSDEHVYPPMSGLLAREGITLLEGYQAEHITTDLDVVVIGNAVSRGNPEVEAVLDRRVRYVSLPEMIRNEFLWEHRSAVVAGTHGKTTTSFMVAWILAEAGLDPSFLVGGISKNLETSARLGTGDQFVIEGDEYDSAFFDKTAKFLKYLPDVVVVNNLEFDHADIYRDLDALRLAFQRLVRLIPQSGRLILNADDAETVALGAEARCPVDTFGLGEADWSADNITYHPEGTRFDVVHGDARTSVDTTLLGAFNVRNALGAMACAAAVGVAAPDAAIGLGSFRGVTRRFEARGRARDVTVYDDFAHHPTAIRETLSGVRAAGFTGKIWALFEPRSATACRRIFQEDFAKALQLADEVIVTAVHRSSIPAAERLSEQQLVDDLATAGVSAQFLPTIDAVVAAVAESAKPGDRVIAMSNGGFGGIHEKLLAALEAR